MEIDLLIRKLTQHLTENLPFVAYSLPEQYGVTALLQKNQTLNTISELSANGFVMTPFEYKGSAQFIPEEDSEKFEAAFNEKEIELRQTIVSQDEHQRHLYNVLVEQTLAFIKGRKANKIVLSRYRDFDLRNFSLEILMNRLFSTYPTAFRYIWYHPQTGLWCGATPETLVRVENNSFRTMALAGTQPYHNTKSIHWGAKELNEQLMVTEAITNSLQKVTSVLKVSNPYTQRAGNLLHLRTDISGILKSGKATLTKIASALHPTPAVCGTPQKIARDFILNNEKYPREYYTGFLGPIEKNGSSSSLMVNLRCMRIQNNQARLYVGGGITIGSKPDDEWQETQNKMQTMLQVLHPML